MTLQEAGAGVGITYQQIRKYESGENRVSASTLYRLARLFGVEPSFFFEGLSKTSRTAGETGPASDVPGVQDALSRIEDQDVRTHLERLIATLERRRSDL